MRRIFAIAIASGMFIGGCSSEPPKAMAKNPAPASKPVAAAAMAAPVASVETDEQKIARAIKTLADNSFYFDFDDYSIKPQYQNLVKQNSQLLMDTPKMSISIVGNADERGSSEYNLALGQKRAESVKRALRGLGVADERLEAISYGKEKPRATCHEEKCWAENRRVDVAASTGKPGSGH